MLELHHLHPAGTPGGAPRGSHGGGGGSTRRSASPGSVPLERQLRRGLTALARAVALEALGLSASVAGGAQAVLQVILIDTQPLQDPDI